MSSSLQFIKHMLPDFTWELEINVLPGGTLPLDIFIFKNSGTTTLGEYQGVCSMEEYQRFQTFVGVVIPKFGNNFVKAGQAKIKLASETDTNSAITIITSSVKALSLALSSSTQTTTVINIP